MEKFAKINVKMLSSERFLLFAIALAYIIIISSLAIMGHNSFYTNAWDLGIYAQALYTTLNHGRLLYYTAESVGNPSGSLFGIHFSPFLLLLLPIYAIYQSPVTLLMLRPVAISIGLIPFYLILRENGIKSKSLLLLLAVLYLFYPPTLTPILNFDILCFLPALFLFALYYLRKGQLMKSYIFIILALMVNEFVSLIVVSTAIYVFLMDWRRNLRDLKERRINQNLFFSIVLLITGFLWFILACKIITYFNPMALNTKWEWGELGSSPKNIILNVLTNPSKVLNALLNDGPKKFSYIVALFGPVMFIPLIEPLPLIMALPWLTASFLSINPLYYSIETQYPAFISPFIFLSAAEGLKRLLHFNASIMRRVIMAMMIFLLLSTFLIPPSMPGVYFESSELNSAIRLALAEIPPNASISVMPDIFPHVCNRLSAYPYFIDGVDYVLINVFSWWYDVTLPRPAHTATRWCDVEIGDEYGIVLNMNGVVLYKRGYSGEVKFSGVRLNYGAHDVLDYAGRIILIEDGATMVYVLVNKPANQSTLFFRTPPKYLPPGEYNVTIQVMKRSSTLNTFIGAEVRTRPGEMKILVKEFSGEHLPPNEWVDLNFSFGIRKPMPIEIAVYTHDSAEVLFKKIVIAQVSGA